MNNVVTQRFIQCVEKLKELKVVKSSRQFAISLDYLPQSLSEMFKGRRDVTIELLRRAIAKYNMSAEYLFSGAGPMIGGLNNDDLKVLSIVTNKENRELIVHVPVAAQAGYADQLMDPVFVGELPTFDLPYDNIRGGSYRSFDVCGNSMEPTLQHGDKVVCSYIEPQYWSQAIKDGQMYVIVTSEGVVVKRVINHLRKQQSVDLVSDNAMYNTQTVEQQYLREMWWVRLRITPYLDKPFTPDADVYAEMNKQRKLIEEMSSVMHDLAGRR